MSSAWNLWPTGCWKLDCSYCSEMLLCECSRFQPHIWHTVDGWRRRLFFSTWDKQARTKLYTSPSKGLPITCCKYDPSGRMIALGLGYDWSLVSASLDIAMLSKCRGFKGSL
eukprot:Gregarina_sp_Poly_1__4807@NODE_2560_length_1980_cov_59_286984_g1014_i1_p2_GENE_NODE_2560_length_1980_cov_59_286984_g1014_i1NODE_2560_length_1980_cov_59_286984_g1014_i1_p2_ORF_typecomplete_len112_score1_57WD40/PF00400_32/0_12_NODE_2560_length_1980_cov_59_286984_g1014_i1148483